MKRLTLLLACSALLAAAAPAQTPSPREDDELLEIHRYAWGEASTYGLGSVPLTDLAEWWGHEHRSGRGNYFAQVVLKNVSRKTIKSVGVDLVFRDAVTEREFLTYHLDFGREIGPGEKKQFLHKIARGREQGNFAPAAPGEELLARTIHCSEGPLLRDFRTKKWVRIRDSEKLLRLYPCFYLPAVTRVEFKDGTTWRPQSPQPPWP